MIFCECKESELMCLSCNRIPKMKDCLSCHVREYVCLYCVKENYTKKKVKK